MSPITSTNHKSSRSEQRIFYSKRQLQQYTLSCILSTHRKLALKCTSMIILVFFIRRPNRAVRRHHSNSLKLFRTHLLIQPFTLFLLNALFYGGTPKQNLTSLPMYRNHLAIIFCQLNHPLAFGSNFRQAYCLPPLSYHFISYSSHSRPILLSQRYTLNIPRKNHILIHIHTSTRCYPSFTLVLSLLSLYLFYLLPLLFPSLRPLLSLVTPGFG